MSPFARAVAAAAATLAATCGPAFAQAHSEVPRFSSGVAGGALPGNWKERVIAKVTPSRVSLVDDAGVTVLEVASRASAGAAAVALHAQAKPGTTLAWRWKVDRVVASADLESRAGDDFAARLYVFFDVAVDTLPWTTRLKMQLARVLHGEELPTAGICYVWDNRHAAGTTAWSPYTDRVRIVVLESGPSRAGQWVEERRDLEADFRAAFAGSWRGAVPPVSGLAAGNDTDQTGESAVARFGDIRIEAAR